jgi:glucosylceramidase
MTRLLLTRSLGFLSLTSLGLALSVGACSSGNTPSNSGGSSGTSGSAGKPSGAGGSTGGTGTGGTGTGGSTGGTGTGGTTGGTGTGGTTGGTGTGGSTGGTGTGGTTGGTGTGGTTGGTGTGGSAGMAQTGGSAGAGMATGGSAGSGTAGMTGVAGSSSTGGPPMDVPTLATSTNAMWTTGMPMDSTGTATVTVNDTMAGQKWDGFGGAFNELGWKYLTSMDMQNQAIKLLFDASNGAAFVWGRIPIGASDYAIARYTEDDTGTDVAAMSGDSNRPAADTSLTKFSTTEDTMYLIPYIKAAQAVNPKLRFWASPWTPPVWMKTGFDTGNGGGTTASLCSSTTAACKPSYFDGGTAKSDDATLTAYAQYYTKFVQAYKAQNINIEIVSPQNEPGYEQNYPSCLWDKAVYTSWVGKYLGPAMKAIGVNVMLGTLSNAGDAGRTDLDISTAVLADATAKSFLTVVGVQWGVLDKVNGGQTFSGLPIWATEHKCGNYPWMSSYNKTQAPNDQAYGVETWGYIRDAITKGKVTAYSAWNMVLDKSGLGNDTSRDWKQDALLVADSGKVNPTQAYYVFRHFSQYVVPGATVVGTSGGDAVAFKNPDGSLVAVMYNSGAANSAYVVSIGGKKLQFSMPAAGWATVLVRP